MKKLLAVLLACCAVASAQVIPGQRPGGVNASTVTNIVGSALTSSNVMLNGTFNGTSGSLANVTGVSNIVAGIMSTNGWRTVANIQLDSLTSSIDVAMPTNITQIQISWNGSRTNTGGAAWYAVPAVGGSAHNSDWGVKVYQEVSLDVNTASGSGIYMGRIGLPGSISAGNIFINGVSTGMLDAFCLNHSTYAGSPGLIWWGASAKNIGGQLTNLNFTCPGSGQFSNNFRLVINVK